MISFRDDEDKAGSKGFLKTCLIKYGNKVVLRLHLILYSCRKKQLTQKRHIILKHVSYFYVTCSDGAIYFKII